MRNKITKSKVAINTNQVTLMGEIVSEFSLDHVSYGKKFYTTELAVKRFSNYTDYIPIIVSEKLIDPNIEYTGKVVYVSGEFRSRNQYENGKNKLKLSVYVKSFKLIDEDYTVLKNENNTINLDGYICKEPILRQTPLKKLDIADITVAVNRLYDSDYIPCICWNNDARLASELNLGSHVKIEGRIQSREYAKKLNETEYEIRVAYEVSVSKLELFE